MDDIDPAVIAVMILCAGKGTRLRPLTEWRAKPMVPLGDRPVLAHVLDRVAAVTSAASRIVVNVHHRAEDVRAFAASTASTRELRISEEVELLGTAGGVARARELLGEGPVLVWNGDILADVDAAALVAFHARAAGAGEALATLAIRTMRAGQGNVGVDAAGHVVRLRQETVREGEVGGGEFLGVHVLGETLRSGLPDRGCLVGDVYLPALRAGARVGIFAHPGVFADIGTLDSYFSANEAWLASRGLAAWSHPTAHVASGVELDASIVGAGARVVGAGALTRVVVWPGAEARAPLTDAVVAGHGNVVRVPRPA